MTRGQLPQRAGSLGLNGGGTAAAVPPHPCTISEIAVLQRYWLNMTVTVYAFISGHFQPFRTLAGGGTTVVSC